ncbi:VOC family protein [Actinophytocola sp.]|uniref:VOC family protein n=1 Tax=Actinophytocola sp. TaxID=1872138 RepID=UPI002ED42643
MTDPFDTALRSLHAPVVPVDPDPSFAARLRERLTRAVLDQGDTTMAGQVTRDTAAWPPTLTPYIIVSDARAALDWYVEVFGAAPRGEPYVNADGTIGHMEVGIGDAVLMFAESSDLYPEVPVLAPDSPTTFSHTLHLQVQDVDETVVLARRRGAMIERDPTDEPYGRTGVLVDPFGHRWMVLTPPGRATRLRQGDIAHVTMVTADAVRAKDFYETVLEVPFTPGTSPGAWGAEDINPPFGMWSPQDETPEVQLCFRVDDITAAVERVRVAGGTAEEISHRPYGLLVECVDDQGAHFQLWQPVD